MVNDKAKVGARANFKSRPRKPKVIKSGVLIVLLSYAMALLGVEIYPIY